MGSFITRLFRRPTHSLTYQPVIDGIRFAAIFMVFCHHAGFFFELLFPGDKPGFRFWNHIVINGSKGVMIFFMLSGFILSLPFARYYLGKGEKIRLGSYYLRRLVRLEPPYIIIMSLWCLLQILESPQLTGNLLKHLLASLSYSHNIIYHRFSDINIVAWSLEVEVQFYLLAPFLCRVFLLDQRTRRLVLLGISAIACIVQLLYPLPFSSLYKYLHYFLLGILLADYYINGWPQILSHRIMPFVFIIWTGIMYLLPLRFSQFYYFLFPYLVFVWMMIILANARVRALFSYGWIPLIGGMCYSIYLIHFPLLDILGDKLYAAGLQQGSVGGLLMYLSIFAALTLLASSVFYLLVEKPFMKLGSRIK